MEVKAIEREDGITQVALIGRLDVPGLRKIDVKFHELTALAGQPSIVDMSQLEFISSIGMGMLISAAQSLRDRNAKLVLLKPQDMVAQVLRTAGVDQGIPIVHSLDDALEALK